MIKLDAGRQLLSRVVDENRITEVTKSGITEEYFDEDSGIVFKHLVRHFDEYKKVPSRDAVLRAFPNFEFQTASEPIEYYIEQVKEAYRRDVLEEKLSLAAQTYSKDTKQAEIHLRDCLTQLQNTDKSFKDISVGAGIDEILEEYAYKKLNPGVDGIRSGWASLDNQTLGWHPGEFVVLAGEKYTGKSWKMIYSAHQAALQGENILFITREMSQTQVRRRLVSIIARIPFDSLRKGELTNSEEKRLKEALETINDETYHFHIAQNGIYNVVDMQRKASEKDATIMFTDSVYLFMPDNKRQRLGEVEKRLAVSQKCKLIAQELKIPFIVSVQAGRRKTAKPEPPNLDNIEWSNAFSQDGDTVFFTQKDDVDKELRRSQIWLLKSRDGQETDFFIHEDFLTMDFSERPDKREPTTKVFDEDEEATLFS